MPQVSRSNRRVSSSGEVIENWGCTKKGKLDSEDELDEFEGVGDGIRMIHDDFSERKFLGISSMSPSIMSSSIPRSIVDSGGVKPEGIYKDSGYWDRYSMYSSGGTERSVPGSKRST